MKEQQEIDQIGALIREARSAQNMTQQQLADKCGIAKSHISKAENDIGNVPVSILRTIVEKGLGGQLQIAFEF
ncbi:helix-turn-helix domain-containing protein [Mucilaginibacter sp. AW1-7]|uniref:helix-turn-helix domain-containing protein n=1 Tax=Mucilaginibacter sp. AW1-7 TaxID=3349874 RepID=UPI003F731507